MKNQLKPETIQRVQTSFKNDKR